MKDGLGFVMGVNLVIWVGIAAYLFFLDKLKNNPSSQNKVIAGYICLLRVINGICG